MNPNRHSEHPTALDRETMIVAAVVLIGLAMAFVDITVINVAIERLAVEFDSSLTTIQWVITGYTLALAAVIPVTGWAADRFGTKRIYIFSLTAFVAGSVLCAFAWSASALIAFRVVQGIGGGMLLPSVTTIVARKAGPHRRGRVMGILGVPLLAAPVLGPILGGWLVDSASWRWIFLINVPIGIIAIVLAALVLDRDEPQPAHRLDWLGMALLSPGLTLALYGFAESSEGGFAAVSVWLPILTGAVLIGAFLRHSWRAEAPLIDVRTFTHTRAGPAAATFGLLTIALFGSLLLLPLYFQTVRGASALEAGLLVAPQGLGAMVTMPIAGSLVDRYGPNWLPLCGIPLLMIGFAPLAFLTGGTPYLLLCGFGFIQGLGEGITFMPAMTAAIQAVPQRALARTSTAMSIIDQSAASIGTAVLSVLLAGQVTSRLTGGDGLEAVHRLPGAPPAAVANPLADAFSATFAWTLAILALACVPAAAMALGRWRRGDVALGHEGVAFD